jgi:hypothetical protein
MRPEAWLWFVGACLLAAVMPLFSGPAVPTPTAGFPGWPTRYEGKALQSLPLSSLEQRFAEDFPGRIGRFSDGRREIVIRWVSQETRKLHPAADCFRGSGYRITPQPIGVDAAGDRWGRFLATRGEQQIEVRERIHDDAGKEWTDVSAWYWAALRGQSAGPWWVTTVGERVP